MKQLTLFDKDVIDLSKSGDRELIDNATVGNNKLKEYRVFFRESETFWQKTGDRGRIVPKGWHHRVIKSPSFFALPMKARQIAEAFGNFNINDNMFSEIDWEIQPLFLRICHDSPILDKDGFTVSNHRVEIRLIKVK